MKRKNVFLLCIFSLLLVVSCSSDTLSDEKAKLLINDANGYPKPIATYFPRISYNMTLYTEIGRLEREGYLEKK